ncbi:DUF4192 domain-containing protein [Nocardia farcinica]|uniref:DUF4192 domain-containing protein n=1 Tax=Nocardia farcinica TaxID=37329 RepID=UPI00189507B3|nr:DUF4192 domain-containing protein [Nocardia farcinica]MBF6373273.1 DUF4192 domain-containing protein [Nocardia farcinica]
MTTSANSPRDAAPAPPDDGTGEAAASGPALGPVAGPAPGGDAAGRCPRPELRPRRRRPIAPPPVTVEAPAECAEAPPAYPGAGGRYRVRIGEPGALIAALPALVGFYPDRSLVVILLGPDPNGVETARVGAAVRLDLDPRAAMGLVPDYAACVARIAGADDARTALLVLVDDRLDPPGGVPGAGFSPTTFAAALAERLGGHGVPVGGAWATTVVATGQPWWSLRGIRRRGRVPDPTASAASLAHVLDGGTILRSREQLVASIAPDPELREQVAQRLAAIAAGSGPEFARAPRDGDVRRYRRRALEFVLWQIASMASGASPTAHELAAVATALRERSVRDAAFGLAVGDHAIAAEQLWVLLVRAGTGADRADAAALLAYCAYVRGDGPLAGVALEAALMAEPSHGMATLLDAALRAGMRPGRIRKLARAGYDTAACLGVDLGPMAV